MILHDRRTKVHNVAEAVGVSYGTAINILYEKLRMRKLSARWIPRLLTVDNKRIRLSTSKQCLDLFKRNLQEICVQSSPLMKPGSITITGQYYSELLDRFDKKLKEKNFPHLEGEKVIFYHDNVPVHLSGIVAAKLNELRYESLPHPLYLPKLASCDFFLFLNMKTQLAGKNFNSNEEIIVETEAYFNEFNKSYFLEGVKKWSGRREKCIALKGDYVEKLKKVFVKNLRLHS